jgi:DNA modification methylase
MSKSELYAVFALPNHEIKNLTFNKIKNYGYSSYTKKQKNQGYKREGKDSLSRMSSAGFTKDNFLCTNDGFRYQTDVIEAPNKRTMKLRERTEHPTQKPVKLIKTLINFITNPNDIILDPFAGSGTLAIACLETGRRYVCIEKEVEYYDIAMRRIEDWHNTPRQQELDLG